MLGYKQILKFNVLINQLKMFKVTKRFKKRSYYIYKINKQLRSNLFLPQS